MASVEKPQSAALGRLVSFEGDIETISTQLRLLPPSQKILVLPSLLENISITDKHSFKPRPYIREVHEAYSSRIETARSFLESSTAWHPKLVLMNVGSVGARATCIASVCQHITNGDVEKAEAIFNDIVKDGVAGLLAQEDEEPEEAESNDGNEAVEKADESQEDPTVKAMKAADSLDRETAALQDDSVGDDSEITIVTPERGSDEAQMEATSENPETAIKRATDAVYKDDIRTTEVIVPDRKDAQLDGLSTFGRPRSRTSFSATTYLTTPKSHTSVDDDDEDYDTDLLSPGGETFSVPPTPRVEYGEACIVDVQSALTSNLSKEVRKTRSMEELSQGGSRPQKISLPPGNLRNSNSEYQLGGRPTSAGGRMEDPDAFVQLPRKAFLRALPTTIRKTQSLLFEPSSSQTTTPTLRIFIDRGADAWGSKTQEKPDSEEHTPYEPVFPALEDFVIHCINDTPNEILASVFQAYKNGTCPTMPTPDSTVSDDECPRTPTNAVENISEHESHETSESDQVETNIQDDFDPYSSDNHFPIIKHNIPRSKFSRIAREPTPEPPSPTIPLRAPSTIVHEKFCELSMLAPSTVIDIQNALRAFLGARFPAGEMGYTQYYFSAAPEADRLWKPVFRNDQNASIGDEGRTVDQIIALGCEDGVKKELFNQISGQVERLGTKRDGQSRSGKLDLRYLISSALQTFAGQTLSARSASNSPNSSTLLATLLVPHIETYLATNPSVRLLILLYPSAHLPTVIALRKLLGQDVLKIAGVVDTLSSDPRPRTPISHPLSNDSTSPKIHKRRGSRKSIASQASQNSFHQSKKSDLSFSKANYLLPSTATDAEIASFLSGIWKSLVEKSAFYTPEPELDPIVVEKIVERIVERKPGPPPKSSTLNPQSPRQARESKISRLTGNNEKRGHKYATSIASSVRSITTVRTMGTVRTTATERGRREVDKAWEDFYIGEVDSDDDEYDRMVMGRAGARIVPEPIRNIQGKKRSSKKALKWLGLA